KDRAFQDVIGLQMLSRLTNVARLALHAKRRRPGPHRQSIDDGQVANQFIRKTVGKVLIGWIVAGVLERQDGNSHRSTTLLQPPPKRRQPNQPSQPERHPQPSAGLRRPPRWAGRCNRRLLGDLAEPGNVAALGQLDYERIALSTV